MATKLNKGDRVAYARTFLRSTGQMSHGMGVARGLVVSIESLGGGCDLALVHWDGHDRNTRVNVKNLVAVKRLHLEKV